MVHPILLTIYLILGGAWIIGSIRHQNKINKQDNRKHFGGDDEDDEI